MYIRKLTCCCPFSVRIGKVFVIFWDEGTGNSTGPERTDWKFPKSYRFSGICSNDESDWLMSIIRTNQNLYTFTFVSVVFQNSLLQVGRQQLNLRRALTEHLFTFARQRSKPLLKVGSVNKAGCFDIKASSLLAFSSNLFWNKTFLFFKIES